MILTNPNPRTTYKEHQKLECNFTTSAIFDYLKLVQLDLTHYHIIAAGLCEYFYEGKDIFFKLRLYKLF